MDLLFTDEQQSMVDAVKDYVESAVPRSAIHTGDTPGEDASALATAEYWSGLAEMGVFSLAVPEEAGGAGLGAADEVAVFREFGRALAVGPLTGTVLAAHVLAAAGESELLDAVTSGTHRVALGVPQGGSATTVGASVSGVFRIHHLADAESVLLVDPAGAALVPASTVGAGDLDAFDPTAPHLVAEVSGTATASVADPRIWQRGRLLTSAFRCGLAEASRDDSAGYVVTREQFGKPIGAFQGVKHRCAEMAVRAEYAWFQTAYAALVFDEGRDDAEVLTAVAAVVSSDAAQQNGADDIQNHGGMGFTAEADPHLYFRRALALRFTFGTPRDNLEVVAQSAPFA